MNALYYAHSGLRYLVLLLLGASTVLFAVGLARKQAFGKLHRAMGSATAGLVHLQVVLGLLMAVMGRFYPMLIGHLVLMLAAAVLLQATLTVNRRRPTPGFTLPVAGAAGALALIVAGILAINRGVFQTTALVP